MKADQVFVDDSGRHRVRARWVLRAVGAAMFGYLALVVVALTGPVSFPGVQLVGLGRVSAHKSGAAVSLGVGARSLALPALNAPALNTQRTISGVPAAGLGAGQGPDPAVIGVPTGPAGPTTPGAGAPATAGRGPATTRREATTAPFRGPTTVSTGRSTTVPPSPPTTHRRGPPTSNPGKGNGGGIGHAR